MDTLQQERATGLTLAALDLINAVTVVAASAYRGKNLPALSGIKLIPGTDTLTLVATDRYRLTEAVINTPGVALDEILLPAAPLAKWLSGLKCKSAGDYITLATGSQYATITATVKGQESHLKIESVGGQYPDHTKLNLTPSHKRYSGAATNALDFDAKKLSEVAAPLAKVAEDTNKRLTLHLPNEVAPILLTLKTERVSYLTALMPLRVI